MMVAFFSYPPDLKAASILKHFSAISSTSINTAEHDTISLGIRGAKSSIKIADLLDEVTSWGMPTLTSWNMTSARRQEILTIHHTLSDLALPELHRKVEHMVTGAPPRSPRWVISPSVNILTHTVLESLPVLARLRMALEWWEDCLERAEARKKMDERRRAGKTELSEREKDGPRVYKEFRNLVEGMGGAGAPRPTPAQRSRPTSSTHENTPPVTPPPPGGDERRSAAMGNDPAVKETFHIGTLQISWTPFPPDHPRYHTHAYIVVYRPHRLAKQLYVSLTSNGGKTAIYVRVGGGWIEFETYLNGFLQWQGGKS